MMIRGWAQVTWSNGRHAMPTETIADPAAIGNQAAARADLRSTRTRPAGGDAAVTGFVFKSVR